MLVDDGPVTEGEREALSSGYSFLRAAENHLRLRSGRGVDHLDFAGPEASKLAHALSFSSLEELRWQLDECRAGISSARDAIMDRVASGA